MEVRSVWDWSAVQDYQRQDLDCSQLLYLAERLPLTSPQTDVGTPVEAAESVVDTVGVGEAGRPAGGLPVGTQLDRRQDSHHWAGGQALLLLELDPRRVQAGAGG